jgi:hypothetical protein
MRATCVAVLILGSATNAAAAEPEHNFVHHDQPVSDGFPYQPEFIDTKSIKREGDKVSFDQLRVSWMYRLTARKPGEASTPTPPEASSDARVEHFVVSCGWRSDAQLAQAEAYTTPDSSPKVTHGPEPYRRFLSSKASWLDFVDKICAGGLIGGQGFPTVKAAFEWSVAHMGDPPKALPAPQAYKPPVEATWMEGAQPHQFADVTVADAEGARLFVDTVNLVRKDLRVSTFDFAVLGPEDHRHGSSYGDVAVLRKVDIDCAAKTLTVGAQAGWNRYGEFQGENSKPFVPRTASESPIAFAEISAVCAGTLAAASHPGIDEAWASARKTWAAPPRPTLDVECIWNGAPADLREAFLSAIAAGTRPAQPMTRDVFLAVVKTCGGSESDLGWAATRYGAYANRQAAVRHFQVVPEWSEARLRHVWLDMPWKDRQRFVRVQTEQHQDDEQVLDAVFARTAKGAGLQEAADLRLLGAFIGAEAHLEPDLP